MDVTDLQSNRLAAKARLSSGLFSILSVLAWVFAGFMVLLLVGVVYWRMEAAGLLGETAQAAAPGALLAPAQTAAEAPLPDYQPTQVVEALWRFTNSRTILPAQGNSAAQKYRVERGDSIFAIAKKFNIKPESILWANPDTLKDDPHMISVGLDLLIPPTDGVYYKLHDGDTLDRIAAQFGVKPDSVVMWPGNKLDVIDPKLKAGQFVMIPGGYRALKPWVVPSIARGNNGTNKSIAGPGACDTGEGGAVGSGGFVWPANNHYLSGNDYWSGHQAIDIAAGQGAPVYAADSGVVVYAGPIGGGYGNMIMIDHGNGYQTLYAHLSAIGVRCGSSVSRGAAIGASGSTGNSTGAHLHFEIRYGGAFVNPWQVLP